MDRKRMRKLYELEEGQWPEADLLAVVRERYAAPAIPPCRICGGELSIQASGGGKPTVYGCSPYEDDPAEPGMLRIKEGRTGVDQHYSDSRHTDYKQGGDSLVMELARRFELLRAMVPVIGEAVDS